jgi:hypothetical protein
MKARIEGRPPAPILSLSTVSVIYPFGYDCSARPEMAFLAAAWPQPCECLGA